MDVNNYQNHIRILEEKIEFLEKENTQLRIISENSTDIISIHSSDGIFRYVSPSCASLLGYSPDEVLGLTPYDFLYPDDHDHFRTIHTKILTDKSINTWSYQIRKKNGKYIWVETTSKYIEVKEPEEKFEIIAITRDITERKQQEQQLEKYQHKLEYLVKERAEKLVQINDKLTTTNEELVATNDKLYRTNLELNRTNKNFTEEIEKRIQIQHLLEESESKFRSFIEQSYEGIVLLNEQGQIVEWNETLSKMLEIPRQQVIYQYVWDIDYLFAPPEQKKPENYQSIVKQTKENLADLHASMEVKYIEGWQQLLSGRQKYLQMSIFPFITQNGKFIGRIINDITEKKSAEEEIDKYRNHLEELVETRTNELRKKEELIHIIENSISYTYGERFFENIVLNISKVLKADLALVGELSYKLDMIDTISLCQNGSILKNIQYSLAGTPFEDVVGKKACVYSNNSEDVFSNDVFLKNYHLQAFIGVPLFDSNGTSVGLMTAMFKSPVIENEHLCVSILQIFASRVGVEIERRRIETSLKTSEEKFRNIVDHIPIGIAITSSDKELIYLNDKLIDTFGYRTDEVSNEAEWQKRGYPDPRYREIINRQWEQDVKDVMSGKLSRSPIREQRIRCSNGSYKDIEVTFSIFRNLFFTIFNDITQRKQVEQKLIDNEQKISNIFNSINDAIIISDLNRNILQVNTSIAKLLNYDLDEFISKPVHSYISPVYRNQLDKRLELILNGSIPGTIEVEVIKKDGSLLPVELNTRQIIHEDKHCLLSIMRDISERKVLEKRMFETIIQIEEKEREKFAANLHDEVGPILSSMKMYVSSLAESDDSNKKNYLVSIIQNLIVEAIATVRDISNDLSPMLLNKHGLEKALSAYLEYKKDLIGITFENNIEGFRFNPNVEVVFYRIIKELFNNTIKHSYASSVVISIYHENENLKLSYLDDGVGFDLASLLNESTNGMGLMNIISRAKTINSKYQFTTSKNSGFKFDLTAPWQ